jgi:hypothetical protein
VFYFHRELRVEPASAADGQGILPNFLRATQAGNDGSLPGSFAFYLKLLFA